MNSKYVACALGFVAIACSSDSDEGRVTGPTDTVTTSAPDVPTTTTTGDTTSPPIDTAPPPPKPAALTWDLVPARSVYRPGQTSTITAEVIGDDGRVMSDVPMTLTSVGAPGAVTFDADALAVDFVTEGELTLELCASDTVCESRTVWVDAGPPTLAVTTPTPGAELGDDVHRDGIIVEGTVEDALDVVVFVNGLVADRSGGAFGVVVPARYGVQHLVVTAVDSLGHEAVVELDVMWAPGYAGAVGGDPVAMGAAEGMLLQLSQRFFDDKIALDTDASPVISKDLAGIFELIIPALNISSFLPDNLGGSGLELTNARIMDSSVDITVSDVGLELFVALDPVRVATSGSIQVGDTTLNLNGSVDVSLASFAEIDVDKNGADAMIEVELSDLVTLVEDMTTHFDDDAANALFALASSQIRDTLEEAARDTLDDALAEALPQILTEALQSIDLALQHMEVPLEEPFDGITLTLDGRVGTLRTSRQEALRGSMVMRVSAGAASAPASRGVAVARIAERTGSLTGGRCGNGVVEPGEDCDDGARVPGDGCDVGCRAEPNWLCGADGCEVVCRSGGGATFDGHSYRFCNRSTDFTSALLYCDSREAKLVSIESEPERDVVREVGGGRSKWLGASDSEVDGAWRWLDGTQFWEGDASGAAVGGAYSAWAEAEPSGDVGDDCAYMTGDGEWFATPCDGKQRFICETVSRCGDGVVADGEICDDGDGDDLDGCTRSCRPSVFVGSPVEVAVRLSFVNGILHQLWGAGLLEIDALSFLEPGLQALVQDAGTVGRLPPIVRTGHPWEDHLLVMSIGQLELNLLVAETVTTFGIRLDAGLDVTMVDNGIVVTVGEVPTISTWVQESPTEAPIITEDFLKTMLLTKVWPDMRSALQSVLNLKLPLPAIDLSQIDPSLGKLEMTLVPSRDHPTIVEDALMLHGALEARLLRIQ